MKIIYVILIMIILVGCGKSNEVMTAKEFKNIMEEKGFTVIDQTDSAADHTYQKIYVAVDEEKYSFEYYFMKDDNSANVVYKYAVDNLQATYDLESTAKISENGSENHFDYKVSASDYYCEVIQNENTVLYVTAYSDREEDAKKIISELNLN